MSKFFARIQGLALERRFQVNPCKCPFVGSQVKYVTIYLASIVRSMIYRHFWISFDAESELRQTEGRLLTSDVKCLQ